MSAPTHAFDVLAQADPQEEPLVPEPVEQKDWRDYAWDARRSITNAERCDRHGDRRVNLMTAAREIALALAALPICDTSTERAMREGLSGGALCPSTK